MNFDNITKNKVTEFSCRHGDKICKVTYEYDIETLEDVVEAFNSILTFLGYSENTLIDYYKEN